VSIKEVVEPALGSLATSLRYIKFSPLFKMLIFYFLVENGEDEPCSGLCYVMKLEKLARQLELSAKQKVET